MIYLIFNSRQPRPGRPVISLSIDWYNNKNLVGEELGSFVSNITGFN